MLVNENKENNENFFFYSLFFFSFSFSFFLFCINLWKKFPLMQFWGKICMYLFIYELGAQVTEKELFVNGSVPPRSRNFYLFVNESIPPSNGIVFICWWIDIPKLYTTTNFTLFSVQGFFKGLHSSIHSNILRLLFCD